MNFSQRMGLEPATKPFQTDSMDTDLRIGLWNCFELAFVSEMKRQWHFMSQSSQALLSGAVFVPLWIGFYNRPLSTMPRDAGRVLVNVATWFHNEEQAPWNKVYEFIEFVANRSGDDVGELPDAFTAVCNGVLEREFSAYRFVGKTITPITNEAEIKAIEQAASSDASLLRPASKHIETALTLLSDRKKPDHRNSMKESISAVEALCKIIAQNDKATLGPALDAVRAKVNLHPKLQDAFKALYGYSNDTHGIRHALKDDDVPDAEDAKFMLVACSAFVNYLTEKARKNGLLPK